MTEHDLDLFRYALENLEWGGTIGGDGDMESSIHLRKSGQRLSPAQQKAVIDDSTSGGLYAAPIFFDDMVIQTPLLYGEFFPSVEVVPITRGRRIEGASISNLTLSGGGFDGTDIPLFTTTAFIAAFDTTIFTANGAVQIGLDFLSDSPVDVAGIMTEQYGRVLLNYLDKNIAAGDGTTQPTGITVASGTVSVAGGSAAPTVGVYESFFFSVAKKYKQGWPNEVIMFGANETTYSRVRAVPVSGTDARRIFGMTHGDYMLMGHKYGISDTLANTKAFFGVMKRYRLYRRLGQTVKVTTEGQTLTRGNLMLLTARSRWGGQPTDGNAFGVSSTMQS
jgi:HK97 family phage major capsid protein